MAAQVLIVGCGRLGAMVAKTLVDRGDRVTIVDIDAENFRRLAEQPGLSMIVANGTSNEDLRRAGVESADVFISLTAQDTVNALAAQIAQVTFGVAKVVCRINDPVRREMYEGLGLRTVSPSLVMTDLVLEAVER
ncbi:MAG: TrkA family potassium uptake protein [Chloroflexi bacterium]|nr:TrkA family potassium uptake protein [Chloroflexota bacterium]